MGERGGLCPPSLPLLSGAKLKANRPHTPAIKDSAVPDCCFARHLRFAREATAVSVAESAFAFPGRFSVGRGEQSALVAAGNHQRARSTASCAGLAEGVDVTLLLRRARSVAGWVLDYAAGPSTTGGGR